MDETKEIEFSKVLDLVYSAVDFDYFDESKFLAVGSMEDPTGCHESLHYFYGYSLMTGRVWFYNDIFIEDGKLSINRWFIDRWANQPCEKKEFQLGSLKKLIEIMDKGQTVINILKE